MRRTGKTTRLIDEAIQMLFNDGEITILSLHNIFDKSEQWKRGLTDKQINSRFRLIDPDNSKDNKAQYHFYVNLRRRLYNEHQGSFIQEGSSFILIK